MSTDAVARFPCDLAVSFRDGDGSEVDQVVIEITIGSTSDGRPLREIVVDDGTGGSRRLRLVDELAAAAPANAVAFRRALLDGTGGLDALASWKPTACEPDDPPT